MGKRLAIGMVMLMVAAAAPAAAGAGRTEEKTYGYVVSPGATSGSVSYSNTVAFETRSTDRFVTLEVVDESGQPVAFDVRQGKKDQIEIDGCGSSAAPIPVRGGLDLKVVMQFRLDFSGDCSSFPTSGVVRATFTR